jgi:hypothetical protein
MQRLLLVDAERSAPHRGRGRPRLHRLTDDQRQDWTRAKAPEAPLLTAIDFLDDRLGSRSATTR